MADEQPKTRIILQGNEQDLRAEMTSLLALRQLIQKYEFGHFVGYPIADYVRMTNENIKLKLRYETNTQPPWRPNENTYLPRPTYSIPNVATSKINWRTIKDAMGGKNGYDWGHWRVAAMLDSKRTIYCFGNTAKEAEKRLEELLKLSNDKIEKVTFSELRTNNGQPRHQAREVYVLPEHNEEKYVFIDDYSTVLDADTFGIYKFDKASVAEFKPADYLTFDTNLARELIEDKLYKQKFLSTGRTKTKAEERTFNGYTYKHIIKEIPILSQADSGEEIDTFTLHTGTDDGVTWYRDEWEIVSGECDVNVFDPDPWKFPQINLPNPDISLPEIPEIKLPEVKINFPKVPVVDIRDFTIDIGEFAPLFSGLHKKLDAIIQRVENIENQLNSVQLPNITWEVPSVGFGDPNLGTENSYPASQKGLQQTFDQLGIILRGLGNTIAHNKTVIAEIGDVFELEDFTFDMPLTFSPGKEDIAELLEETNCESEGIRFKGKDTLQSSLQDLLQAAAIARAKNFIGLGKDLSQSEITKKIVSRIKEVANNKKWLQNFGGSFDDFIKDVESGFTEGKPGAKSIWQDGQEPEITELEIPKDDKK